MMKSLAVSGFIFLLAASANAPLMISVNGVVEPPLGKVVLQPGETAVIGIHGDGLTAPPIDLYLFVEGPGSIDGHTGLYRESYYVELESVADTLGMSAADALALFRDSAGRTDLQDLSLIRLAHNNVPMSALVDGIIFRCSGLGDVTLTLVSDDFTTVYNTQTVEQIRLPMTLLPLVLLGLGALFVVAGLFAVARRRRKRQA
jgi:hypothetical protein